MKQKLKILFKSSVFSKEIFHNNLKFGKLYKMLLSKIKFKIFKKQTICHIFVKITIQLNFEFVEVKNVRGTYSILLLKYYFVNLLYRVY